jgi:predicted nucleic acid-binding Zn ribbon protein
LDAGKRKGSAQLIVPVYVYRRRDGSSFELEQRITADALDSCPTTGQSVQRVMQPFSPRYKGTGFYSTDHRKTAPGSGRSDLGAGAVAGGTCAKSLPSSAEVTSS